MSIVSTMTAGFAVIAKWLGAKNGSIALEVAVILGFIIGVFIASEMIRSAARSYDRDSEPK